MAKATLSLVIPVGISGTDILSSIMYLSQRDHALSQRDNAYSI